MNDIWTMIWKETKDSVLQGGRTALIRPLLVIGVLGILLPLRLGLQWLALTPTVIVVVLYIPFIIIISFVGDAIAGERERHTLETLLASRMPDRAILLGKVIVMVGYAWGMALVGLLLGLVVANLSKGQGRLGVLYACRLVPGSARFELAHQSAGHEWRSADLAADSHGEAGATNFGPEHVGTGRRRRPSAQSCASAGVLIIELSPDTAHCHGSACRPGCGLVGSLADELPPLALDVELGIPSSTIAFLQLKQKAVIKAGFTFMHSYILAQWCHPAVSSRCPGALVVPASPSFSFALPAQNVYMAR